MPLDDAEFLEDSTLQMQSTLTAYKGHEMHWQQLATPDLHVYELSCSRQQLYWLLPGNNYLLHCYECFIQCILVAQRWAGTAGIICRP